MKRKRIISVIAILLIVLMLISLVMSVIPVSAFAISEGEIDSMRQQRQELSNQVQEIQERIDGLKDQQANVLEQKTALDEKNRLANEELDLVADEIAYYDQLIEEKAKEVQEAMDREAGQLQRYRARVRAMEENGGYNILALILGSDSFSQMLTAIDDMGEIMASDKALEEQYIEARQETETVKAEYEAERTEYEAQQGELREERDRLEKEIEDAYAQLDELESAIAQAEAEYEAALIAEESAAAEVQRAIQQYLAQQAAQQQQQQQQPSGGGDGGDGGEYGDGGDGSSGGSGGDPWANNPLGGGSAQGTGSFIWPVPCSTRITGRFLEPRSGHLHQGLDIDGFGNDGGPIIAADGGVVITSQYDSVYGNYVVIDHGGGIQTVYAHNSANNVSVGDTVSQGDTIAFLGATGNATGTHCHFEIFVNGNRVDPAAYFTGLTYYQC